MRAAALLALALMSSGCFVDLLMTSAATSGMVADHTTDTMETMAQARVDLDIAAIRSALSQYQAELGRYPADLHDLVPDHLATVPLHPDSGPYDYNPVTGAVSGTTGGPAPADFLTMESLKTAINRFGMSTGYYPPTLDDLYPHFMPSLPRTVAGAHFIYDNQNGQLRHPIEEMRVAQGVSEPEPALPRVPVTPSKAVGSLSSKDVNNPDSLNRALDRIGY